MSDAFHILLNGGGEGAGLLFHRKQDITLIVQLSELLCRNRRCNPGYWNHPFAVFIALIIPHAGTLVIEPVIQSEMSKNVPP